MIARPVLELARRSLAAKFRHPRAIVPDFATPLLIGSVLSATFAQTTSLAGFPTRSFLDFIAAGIVVLAVFFTAGDVGDEIGLAIEDGFFDRILTAPVPRSALLLGSLAGAVVFAAFQAAVVLLVLVIFGLSISGGPVSVLAFVIASMGIAAVVGTFSAGAALRAGSEERFEAQVPIYMIVMFVSSAFFPRSLMSGWFKTVASLNPLSWLVDDLRAMLLTGFDAAHFWRAAAVLLLFWLAAAGLARRALQRRLLR